MSVLPPAIVGTATVSVVTDMACVEVMPCVEVMLTTAAIAATNIKKGLSSRRGFRPLFPYGGGERATPSALTHSDGSKTEAGDCAYIVLQRHVDASEINLLGPCAHCHFGEMAA